MIYKLIYIGCLTLNLSYSGCCVWSSSLNCSINDCFCDQICYYHNDCCNDIADIFCFPAFSTSLTPTPTDTHGKKESVVHTMH